MRFSASLVLAAFSWAAISAALLVPLVWGLDSNAVIAVVAYVVGMQAAQSSVVQVAPRSNRRPLAHFVAAALSVLLTGVGAQLQNAFAVSVVCTAGGACIGLTLGAQASRVLRERGGLKYQVFQATRAVVLLFGVAAFALVGDETPAAAGLALSLPMVLSAALLPIQARFISRTHAPARPAGHLSLLQPPVEALWVGLGTIAALFYRNDTTWLRASLAESPEFDTWHIGLVIYSAAQGFVGFFVVQRLFAHRDEIRPKLVGIVVRARLAMLPAWVVATTLAIGVSASAGTAVSIAASTFLAIAIGFASGIAHVLQMNWLPYVAGVAGTALLLVLLTFDFPPGVVLASENGLIGTIILTGLVVGGNKPWASR